MQYVVARYYFDSLFREEANKTFIDDLKKEPFVEAGLHMYALGDFSFEHHNKFAFLRGTFGKVIKLDSSKIYNKKKHEFIEGHTSDKVLATIEFLIHHETHLIFIEKSSKLDYELVKNKFIEIYEKNSLHPASFKIDFILDEADIYETLKTWDVITKANFKNLRSSNPSCDDTFEDIDKLIKETNSNSANLNLKTNSKNNNPPKEGLNADSLLFKQALALSSQGYGEAKLEGIKESKPASVTTKKVVRKIVVNYDEDGALESFAKTIEEVQKYERK